MDELAKQIGSTGPFGVFLALVSLRVWMLEKGRREDQQDVERIWKFLNGSDGRHGLTQRVSSLEAFHKAGAR